MKCSFMEKEAQLCTSEKKMLSFQKDLKFIILFKNKHLCTAILLLCLRSAYFLRFIFFPHCAPFKENTSVLFH